MSVEGEGRSQEGITNETGTDNIMEQVESDSKQRREALQEAQRVSQEMLNSGESPKVSISKFLMILNDRGQLRDFDCTLAICALSGNTTKEDAEKLINGYTALKDPRL